MMSMAGKYKTVRLNCPVCGKEFAVDAERESYESVGDVRLAVNEYLEVEIQTHINREHDDNSFIMQPL